MSQINISVREFIDTYQNVIGHNSDSQCAYDLINRARIMAYPMGDWVGTIAYRPVAINHGRFTLPYDLDVIREAKNCGRNITVNSLVSKDEFCSCGETVITRIEGRVYSPFQLTEKTPVCIHAINKKDQGKIVRVQYFDWAGTMHDEEIELGHSQQGATRLQNIPERIHRITKPHTRGMVAFQQGSNISYFNPEDKNPSYTVYCVECGCGCIVISAKKKYIPYTIDSADDILDINPQALSSLIVAIKAQDSKSETWLRDHTAAVKLAKDFLNTELSNEQVTNIGMVPVQLDSQLTEDLANAQSKY